MPEAAYLTTEWQKRTKTNSKAKRVNLQGKTSEPQQGKFENARMKFSLGHIT